MNDQIELKKFAITSALHLTVATGSPAAFTGLMNDMWNFLSSLDKETDKTKESAGPHLTATEVEARRHAYQEGPPPATFPEIPHAELPVRQHSLPPLTTMQKAVLKACIELWKEEAKVNSTDIGRHMRWTSPSAANPYVKILVKTGYVRRDGWFITPLYHHDGSKVAPVVQRLPDGVAKGYKPLTVPMGTVGRIS